MEEEKSDLDLAVSILETEFPDDEPPDDGESSDDPADLNDEPLLCDEEPGYDEANQQPPPASAKKSSRLTPPSFPVTKNATETNRTQKSSDFSNNASSNERGGDDSFENPTSPSSGSPNQGTAQGSTAGKTSVDAEEFDKVPIILSRDGWASNHSGLMKIIDQHKIAYSLELKYGPCRMPDRSPAVNKVIAELVQNYKPKILLETSEEPTSLQRTQLDIQDIAFGGKFHALMAQKVLECFERAHLEDADFQESPLPKSFKISQSPESSPDTSAKRALPTRGKQQAVTTPTRARAKRDLSAEKTPIAGNKKLREELRDVVQPRSASRAASREAKRLMQELPTSNRRYIRVDQLAYNWSGLDINGTAAWNRFLHERNDPRIELQPPIVTTMDTYQLVQSVKAGLATITPPSNSFLYEALAEDYDVEDDVAESPADRLKALFRKMANYETIENASKRKHEYHLMKEDEIQDYLVEIEKDMQELDEIESQLDDDKLEGTEACQIPTRLPKANRDEELKNTPVFWQKDFVALLNNKGPATRYLMAQDQF